MEVSIKVSIMNKILIICFVSVLVCVIIFRMTEQTWGDLPESQISSRLITQAISDAISEHESDPEAHLGSGESLEQHKSNDVIDHPAGSVLNDKFSMTEYSLVPILTDNSLFTTIETGDGYYDDANPPGVSVNVFGDSGSASRSALLSGFGSLMDYDRDTFIEYNFILNEHAHYKAYMNFGTVTSGTPVGGFGFEIDDDVLKGFYVNGGGVQRTSSLTFSRDILQNLRAVFVLSENTIHFFVNGSDVAQLAVSFPLTGSTYNRLQLSVWSKTTGTEVALFVFNVFFSRSII